MEEDEDGYLMQALIPVYTKCNRLKDTLSKGVPFAAIFSSVETAFEEELDTQQPRLLENVKNVFDMVLKDFDLMFVVDEIPDPQKEKLRLQINNLVEKAKAQLAGPIATEFALAAKDSD
ncbi:MAG: hypothetical protein Q9164_004797 [Protoblastenia rupestris]